MKRSSTYPIVLAAAVSAMSVISPPLRASETDRQIESTFRSSYVYKTYLEKDSVSVDVNEGAATLTGTVTEDSHRALAEETLANLPGVTRVDNKLLTKGEVATENSDLWISRKITFTLFLHRHVNAHKTTVDVKEGIVTLTGEAASTAQKELTAEYANDIDGVKKVVNQMTVLTTPEPTERTPGEKMDDASITAQVKTALFTHRSTNSLKTKVETRNGTVTLTGIANNAAEKALVTKLVNDIKGVDTVKNEMTVEVPKTK